MKREMTGREFEEYCADLLRRKGYKKVRVTKGSGDQGADILAKRWGKTYAVQCKLYRKPVGNSAVQEAFAGKQFYSCDRGMVMTNSTFTRGARELAERTEIQLWEEIPLKRGGSKALLFFVILAALAAGLYLSLQAVN